MQLQTEDKWDQRKARRTDEVQNKVLPVEMGFSWWLLKMVNGTGEGGGGCYTVVTFQFLSADKRELMAAEQETKGL